MDAGASTRLPENDVGRDGGGADGGDHGGGGEDRRGGAGRGGNLEWHPSKLGEQGRDVNHGGWIHGGEGRDLLAYGRDPWQNRGGGARIAGAGPAAGATWNGVRRSLESGAET
jgi:hypothetical protein